jgi:nitrite reductase (NADH) small subunit
MNDWIEICRVDDIPVLGARRVRRPAGTDVAIFRNESDRVFALLDRCPHKGGPLSQGIMFGEHVACPLHNWAISLEDGQARAPDVGCATKFAVRVEDGVVSLSTSELATLAVDEGASAGVDPATARRMTAALSADSGTASSCDAMPASNRLPGALSACDARAAPKGLSSCAQSQDPPRPRTVPIVNA